MTKNINNKYTPFDWDNSQYIKKLKERLEKEHNGTLDELTLNQLKNMLDSINGQIAISLIQFLKEKDVLIKDIFIDSYDFDIELENWYVFRKYRFQIKNRESEDINWMTAKAKINEE